MAKLVQPTEAYVEAEIYTEVNTPNSGERHTPAPQRFTIEGSKIYLPNLGSNPRGTRHYMTYNELCELISAYEQFAGIGSPKTPDYITPDYMDYMAP